MQDIYIARNESVVVWIQSMKIRFVILTNKQRNLEKTTSLWPVGNSQTNNTQKKQSQEYFACILQGVFSFETNVI